MLTEMAFVIHLKLKVARTLRLATTAQMRQMMMLLVSILKRGTIVMVSAWLIQMATRCVMSLRLKDVRMLMLAIT